MPKNIGDTTKTNWKHDTGGSIVKHFDGSLLELIGFLISESDSKTLETRKNKGTESANRTRGVEFVAPVHLDSAPLAC